MSQQHVSPKTMVWADGGTIFAAVVLTTVGVFQALEGLSAISKDDVFVSATNYVFDIDLTAWGWLHLLLGALAVAIGVCMLLGQGWALIAGIVVAMLSALTNFMFIPYYPVWALVVIALDLFVIWSISTVWSALR
jgi:hypothetical protein